MEGIKNCRSQNPRKVEGLDHNPKSVKHVLDNSFEYSVCTNILTETVAKPQPDRPTLNFVMLCKIVNVSMFLDRKNSKQCKSLT